MALGTGDRIVGFGDFDGDGKTEILITSGSGIGILKQQGNTIESPLLYPNNTGFGDWRYETHNTISGLGDFDGDGKTEILITSGWGIGILKQQGNAFGCLDLRAYGSMIGNWFLEPDDGVVGIGNLTSAPGQDLLLQKKPKNGNTVRRMSTPVTLPQ